MNNTLSYEEYRNLVITTYNVRPSVIMLTREYFDTFLFVDFDLARYPDKPMFIYEMNSFERYDGTSEWPYRSLNLLTDHNTF